MQSKDFKGQDLRGWLFNAGFNRENKKMNIAEHRLTISHQLEELSEASLIEVEKLIAQLKSKKKSRRNFIGCMKGLVVYMADDFDVPLDDFKNYMP
jgi:adenylylsulfate kinase-like enzyme